MFLNPMLYKPGYSSSEAPANRVILYLLEDVGVEEVRAQKNYITTVNSFTNTLISFKHIQKSGTINFFVHIAIKQNLNLKIQIQKVSDKKSFKQSKDSSVVRCLVIYCTYLIVASSIARY